MKRIGDVLRERNRPPAEGDAPRWRHPNFCEKCQTAPCQCAICHGAGFYRTPREDGRIADVFQCECRKASVRQQTVAALAALSVLPKLERMTFEAFDAGVPGVAEAYEAAQLYAGNGGAGWLVLHGGVGVGKTHLAAAIGNELAARGEGVVMHVVPELLREFRRTISEQDNARFHRLFDGTLNSPVLILDDFGAENATDWAREQLFLVLDDRYRRRAPLVVTTNALGALEPRVRDRLSDDGLSVVVRIEAPSYRQRPEKYRALRLVE